MTALLIIIIIFTITIYGVQLPTRININWNVFFIIELSYISNIAQPSQKNINKITMFICLHTWLSYITHSH
jgi:hypothetical protein